jgi:hypothetical protein
MLESYYYKKSIAGIRIEKWTLFLPLCIKEFDADKGYITD